MIPAIEPGIGLKDDRPAPRAVEPGNPGFSQALKKASGREQAARRRTLDEAQKPGDGRARDAYGKDAGDVEATDRTHPSPHQREARAARAAREGKAAADAPVAPDAPAQPASELQEAAQQAGDPGQEAVAAQPETLAATAAAPGIAALALGESEAVQGEPLFGVPNDATPITAQIGSAAYRLGAHGNGEAELAEAQGQVLPGTTKAAMLGKGINDVRRASMQETEQSDVEPELGKPVAAEADILQVSAAAKSKEPRGLAHKEQIALQTAQSRNEVLSRLSTTAGEESAASGASGEALRQHMQLQGLLARNARAHALQTAAPTPDPASTGVAGLAVPATSVDLTQVFETPQDTAVQQRVIDRVANEARWLINNGRQEVTFRLHPEHLGSLHMKVRSEQGVLRVDVTVDNLAAKNLLESNLQDLRNRLAQENPGGQFMFNVDVRQGNEQPSLYARAQRSQTGGSARASSVEQAAEPSLAGRVMNQTGLSIYV